MQPVCSQYPVIMQSVCSQELKEITDTWPEGGDSRRRATGDTQAPASTVAPSSTGQPAVAQHARHAAHGPWRSCRAARATLVPIRPHVHICPHKSHAEVRKCATRKAPRKARAENSLHATRRCNASSAFCRTGGIGRKQARFTYAAVSISAPSLLYKTCDLNTTHEPRTALGASDHLHPLLPGSSTRPPPPGGPPCPRRDAHCTTGGCTTLHRRPPSVPRARTQSTSSTHARPYKKFSVEFASRQGSEVRRSRPGSLGNGSASPAHNLSPPPPPSSSRRAPEQRRPSKRTWSLPN